MLLPVGDNVDRRSLPVVPAVLVFANLLVFVIQVRIFLDNPMTIQPTMDFIEKWGLVPADLQQGRYVGLFTHMFLHGGISHILGNMLVLWAFAWTLEIGLGGATLLVFYLIWGVIAGGAHALTEWGGDMPLVGASGAIAGLMGAYFVLYGADAKIKTVFFLGFKAFVINIPAALYCIAWFWLQVWSASNDTAGTGGVAWYAHIGGFAAGALTALLVGSNLQTCLVRDGTGELVFKSTLEQDEGEVVIVEGDKYKIAEHDTAGDGSTLPEDCPHCGTALPEEARITPGVARCLNEICGRFVYPGASFR
ncbi:MAG: hypothetical protein CMJ58_13820 [Planctomycetaceae bacterium]|nr:hypothetical protein [Planctomycetaceae bacterium]